MKTLTFGSYNLENGGLDASMRDGRLVRQLAMLADAHADAWAIQEAKHWAADGCHYLHFAEQRLGMRGFLAPSSHHGCDLAVFVRESSGITVVAQRHEVGQPYWHQRNRAVVKSSDVNPRESSVLGACRRLRYS